MAVMVCWPLRSQICPRPEVRPRPEVHPHPGVRPAPASALDLDSASVRTRPRVGGGRGGQSQPKAAVEGGLGSLPPPRSPPPPWSQCAPPQNPPPPQSLPLPWSLHCPRVRPRPGVCPHPRVCPIPGSVPPLLMRQFLCQRPLCPETDLPMIVFNSDEIVGRRPTLGIIRGRSPLIELIHARSACFSSL